MIELDDIRLLEIHYRYVSLFTGCGMLRCWEFYHIRRVLVLFSPRDNFESINARKGASRYAELTSMVEVLSVVGSVVRIVQPGLTVSKGPSDYYASVRNSRSDVMAVCDLIEPLPKYGTTYVQHRPAFLRDGGHLAWNVYSPMAEILRLRFGEVGKLGAIGRVGPPWSQFRFPVPVHSMLARQNGRRWFRIICAISYRYRRISSLPYPRWQPGIN
jgi:hypothetical protein